MKLARAIRRPPVKDPLTSDDLNSALQLLWSELVKVINGNLWFGSPATGRNNIDGEPIQVVTPGVADTAFTLTHNLGRVPVGYIVTYLDQSAVIYNGGGAWTATTISLKASAATVTLRVFVF